MSAPPAAGDDPDDDDSDDPDEDSDWSDDGRGDDHDDGAGSNGGDRVDGDRVDGDRVDGDRVDGDRADDGGEPVSDRHGDGDDREWEISLEDLEDDGQPGRPAIEPGSPSLENAAFVAVGVLLTLYVLFGGL